MHTLACKIKLENTGAYYRPGETIKGLVALDISGASGVLLKALSLQFSGFAHTKWEMLDKAKKSGKPESKTFVEYREDYLSAKNYLIGSEMASPKFFDPGEYSYNFVINLPQNMPSTFDSPLGFIRYTLTVDADCCDHSTTLCHSSVVVEQLKDLRLMDAAVQLPAEAEQIELKSRLKFWQRPLQLYIKVPQKAFTAGECISVYIKLTNPCREKIDSITGNLNRLVTYKGLLNNKSWHKTTEKSTIVSNVTNMNGKNSKLLQVSQEMVVPKTPPSMAVDECKCIELSYELEVLATSQNKKRQIKASIPLLLGSISLRSDVKVMPLQATNNNVASIAVARSMEELTLPSAMDLEDNILSISISSLESSFREADFMATVHFNKKSRHSILGDLNDYKPKYLYYELLEEPQSNTQDDVVTAKADMEFNRRQ